jgi:hypothetical protein
MLVDLSPSASRDNRSAAPVTVVSADCLLIKPPMEDSVTGLINQVLQP